MKKLKILSFIFLFGLTCFADSSLTGDVIGGNTEKILEAFKLDETLLTEMRELREFSDAEIVKQAWMEKLSDEEKTLMLEKVFDNLMVPQIEGKVELPE